MSDLKQTYPFVSIIIIVYNMEKTIKKCLDSILNLDYPHEHYEVIVVDGGSTDRTDEIIHNYNVKTITEKIRCRGAARYAGILHSKGEIVAFIDADCEADRKWLLFHVVAHQNYPNVGAVGGSTERFINLEEYRSVNEKLYKFFVATHGGEDSTLSTSHYVSFKGAANLSLKRKVITSDLLNKMKVYHIGEDQIICSKVFDQGYKILFEPAAKVIHNDCYRYYLFTSLSKLMHSYSVEGQAHYQLQAMNRMSSKQFRLPMHRYLRFFFSPMMIALRVISYIQIITHSHITESYNVRTIKTSIRALLRLEWIKYIHFIFLFSICWVQGYLSEGTPLSLMARQPTEHVKL
jgi:glycosyltransferase involved in cell wall biosynthesis